ncbi:MAG: aldehyde dehydrogenase family protein, partial [Planctomycetales bacterium]|nr:aldehyde dehydrogenase family protein [Planctomycetales bacterium]
PQPLEFDGARTYLRYDPIGPVLAVMPWNFPLWQVFRFAAPTLLAGNVALLKHASNVSGCALAIERIFRLAEFPPSTFTTLLIGSNEVADVIAHPAVRAVTLTGSDAAGRSVSRVAGEHLKKTVLELGGSDPFIVLADADVESTARAAAQARTLNSGQSCIAAKRFIVHESIAAAFAEAMVAEMRKLRVGDPLDSATDVGPLARADLRDDLHDQVERSVQAGAKLLTGGRAIESPGFFYEPAVLDRVTMGMAAFDEETFGPVAAIIRASDDDEAIELANRSAFGLGASVWSRDVEHAERLTPRIDSGMVFVNEIVKSDPRLPFGGVKDSGYGRELSNIGIREFTNVKTVWVNNRA